MNTDSFFQIGSTHEVCQDYAISGNINQHISYAIITDGCSQSQANCGQADLGARVIAYGAKDAITDIYGQATEIKVTDKDHDEFKKINAIIRNKVIDSIVMIGKLLKLSKLYADCTLLIVVSDGKKTNIFVYGDGGVAVRYNDESVLYRNVVFSSGAPYYLSYANDTERNVAYKIQFGGSPVCINSHAFNPELKWHKHDKRECIANEGLHDMASFSIEDARTVSVFSDGIGSFDRNSEADGIKHLLDLDVLMEYISYKNKTGEFVKRRMKRMMQTFVAEGVSHYDDISVATINMG